MNRMVRSFLQVRERLNGFVRGQTMTEYALILAAVAVVVFATYETMGQNIESLLSKVDSSLTGS